MIRFLMAEVSVVNWVTRITGRAGYMAGGVLALLVMLGMWLCLRPALPEQADYYPKGRPIADFSLIDSQQQPLTLASLQGYWTFLFVGYTYCPDVCPTTMADMRSVYDRLKLLAGNSQVLFISADPQRDSVERLRSYTAFFHPEFKAATAPHPQLFSFVRSLGLIYAIADQGEQDYFIDHSASIVLINPQGRLQAVFRPSQQEGISRVQMDGLVRDFTRILALQ